MSSRFPGRRVRQALACVGAVAALTACGGGTSQYEPFVAQRVIAFGDEDSTLTAAGLKYSINGFSAVQNPDGSVGDALDCNVQPIWVQSLAGYYGFRFPQCAQPGVDTSHAVMLAFPGAKVEDFKVQIDTQVAAGGFRDGDLTSVLIGSNDIIELYQQFPGRTEADLTNEAGARGRRLADQVNRLVAFGAKVIVSTLPDLGYSPYAAKQSIEFGAGRAEMISRLVAAFNEQLGVNILLDGRYIGLVQADLRTQAVARDPASFGLINARSAACLDSALPPVCTTKTLVAGATATNYLWADDLHMAYSAQAQIGALAVDRAARNPF